MFFFSLLLPSYTFYVIAMDQGDPPLNSSTLHVNITLVDENDNNPKFEQAMYSVEIWENQTIGGHVVQVKATERDSGIGSHIGYNISAGDPHGQFKIFYISVSSSCFVVIPYYYLLSWNASAAYQASLFEPWFVVWRAKIPMARPNDRVMLPKGTRKL